MNRLALRTFQIWAIASFLPAGLLTALLLVANPGTARPAVALELFAVMLWVSALVHAAVAAGLALLRGGLGFAFRLRPSWPPFLAFGLLAFEPVWILWNRLGMAHQFASVRPFLTWTGVLENLLLGMLGATVLATGLAARRWGPVAAVPGLLIGAGISAGLLARNAAEEVSHRIYSPERILEAAGPARGIAARMTGVGGRGPVIVLGIDGLDWSVMVPLLEEGALPNLAATIRGGSFGYLDNGDESLSARIWNTIYSGRSVTSHGIPGFWKLELPRSGASFPELLIQPPGIDTFYGLRRLLAKLPSAGLWRMAPVDSGDRRVKMIWDVASEAGQRVVVANALTSVPVRPVNGAMIALRSVADASNTYPPELARRWRPTREPPPAGVEEEFDAFHQRLREEVAFTRDLFRQYRVDLGVYYTHFLDTISHRNWDFHSRGSFLIRARPEALDEAAWEALVRERLADPAFLAYVLIDRILGEFRRDFPDATFLICSDHGWTYSGYEHFGSPDGVVILSGPQVRRGRALNGCRTEDIAPTVLALLGIPLSGELEGRPWGGALEEPGRYLAVDSYGDPAAPVRAVRGSVEDREELQRLRSLGYLN